MNFREILMAKAMAGGSGGGGVSSWNDLTDKPFGEEVAEAEIIPETMLEELSGAGGVSGSAGFGVCTNPVEVGKQYTVYLDSGSYEAVCELRPEYGNLPCLVGETFDVVFIGGEFECNDQLNGTSIRVTGEVETIKPIDEKYLPDSVKGGGGDIVVVSISLETMMLSHTPDEIEAMQVEGKLVLCNLTGTTFYCITANGEKHAYTNKLMKNSDGISLTVVKFDNDGRLVGQETYLLTANKQ